MEAVHAEMAVPQLRGGMRERTTVSLDDDDNSSAVASVLVEASTSGRVESAFWDERRQRRRRRRRAWASPTGVLYVVNRPSNFVYNELEQGRKVEENVSIDVKHSVSTCFEQGRLGDEKSILMTTSHKLDANHMLTTHYVNNLDGDYEYTCNTSHAMLPASRLSTCLYLTSIGDPTLEVELEQEQETKKMSETILANLRTGERFLKLQFKNNITDNVALSNTYITDLRGKHSVNLKAALPLFGFANISKSFTTNFQESYEFCLNTQQRISELQTLKTKFIRNNNQIRYVLSRFLEEGNVSQTWCRQSSLNHYLGSHNM